MLVITFKEKSLEAEPRHLLGFLWNVNKWHSAESAGLM
uniref:Uncharacterized protein n=1 Tax=Anguilla anguilla TaxID=7936 RepID=A0A0E9QN40_ANGAN